MDELHHGFPAGRDIANPVDASDPDESEMGSFLFLVGLPNLDELHHGFPAGRDIANPVVASDPDEPEIGSFLFVGEIVLKLPQTRFANIGHITYNKFNEKKSFI